MISNNHLRKHEVGAVVLGGDYQGLGIVRSLGRRGVPVCVVDDERSIARYSRYTTLHHRVSSMREAKQTVQLLLEVGRKRGLHGWVLYPTRDELVAAISQYREELSEVFRVPTPGWEAIKWLWDKRNTYRLAADLGVPIPRTWYPRDVGDLDQIEGHFPVALKPAIKEHFVYATKDKAWRADTPEQLRELFHRALRHIPAEEIMIQDLIPGNGNCQYAHCSLFKQGNFLARISACRRRQHPIEFGRSSTYVETMDVPLLEQYSQKLLGAIDYYGLVEVEYKRDPRDGQYRLLDINARTWGYHTIGQRAGVDFPYLLFADQVNEPVPSCTGKVGVRWIRLLTDLPTGVVGILSGQIEGGAYLKSLRNFDEEAVFSLEDPLPGLAEITLLPYLYVKRGF